MSLQRSASMDQSIVLLSSTLCLYVFFMFSIYSNGMAAPPVEEKAGEENFSSGYMPLILPRRQRRPLSLCSEPDYIASLNANPIKSEPSSSSHESQQRTLPPHGVLALSGGKSQLGLDLDSFFRLSDVTRRQQGPRAVQALWVSESWDLQSTTVTSHHGGAPFQHYTLGRYHRAGS